LLIADALKEIYRETGVLISAEPVKRYAQMNNPKIKLSYNGLPEVISQIRNSLNKQQIQFSRQKSQF
jgi:hypothetical protein